MRRKSVATLNELSAEQLAEARRRAAVSVVDAVEYLRALVVECNLGDGARFVDEVVLRGATDPATWGREDVLTVPLVPIATLVTRPIEEILEPLQEVEGPRMRLAPDRTGERGWYSAAPGVLTRSRPYWQRWPHGTTTVVVTSNDRLEPFADMALAGRRWLASRIAERLGGRPLPGNAAELASALGAAGPVSRDAEIALAALRREEAMGGSAAGVPGFRGPDEWFA